MLFRKILGFGSAIVSSGLLAVGLTSGGAWVSVAALLLTLPLWFLAGKKNSSWINPFALVVTICLATFGIFIGASPYLMITAASFGLAGWDLIDLDHILVHVPSPIQSTLVEKKHYRSLGLAFGVGLTITLLGQSIQFQIPFGLLLLLVIVILYCFDRIWHRMK